MITLLFTVAGFWPLLVPSGGPYSGSVLRGNKATCISDSSGAVHSYARVVKCRYVHGPAAAIDQGLAAGDLEAALLAGLAKTKRNQTIARLLQAGRPPPSGYVLSQQAGRVSVVSAPHHQGGHMWHGGKVVERVLATYGTAGLQVLAPFLSSTAHSFGCL